MPAAQAPSPPARAGNTEKDAFASHIGQFPVNGPFNFFMLDAGVSNGKNTIIYFNKNFYFNQALIRVTRRFYPHQTRREPVWPATGGVNTQNNHRFFFTRYPSAIFFLYF
ncbi:MAG: hypothetical protein WAM73_20320 [Desulfobacterales bacterium]